MMTHDSPRAIEIWLPKDIYGPSFDELERRLGLRWNGRADTEGMHVLLPPGWGVLMGDPAQDENWYYLLDEQKRKRAVIVEQYQFNEERSDATCHWLRRYGVHVVEEYEEGRLVAVQWRIVNSDSQCLREGFWHRVDSKDPLDAYLNAIEEGAGWLWENKPDWQDYFAYWSD